MTEYFEALVFIRAITGVTGVELVRIDAHCPYAIPSFWNRLNFTPDLEYLHLRGTPVMFAVSEIEQPEAQNVFKEELYKLANDY